MKFNKNIFLFAIALFLNPNLNADNVDIYKQLLDMKTQIEDLKEFVKKKFDEIEARETDKRKDTIQSKVKVAAERVHDFVSPAVEKTKAALKPVAEKVKEYSTDAKNWISNKISPDKKNEISKERNGNS